MSMRIFQALVLGGLMLMPVRAAADPAQIAQGFAHDFIIPRFQAVAVAAHEQAGAWSSFCADRAHGDPQKLRQAFNGLGDVWAKVEFMHIGPASVALRFERFNWWLDRTNATGKALDAMLTMPDPESLTPEKLAMGSVAGQGLPIIEHLLYEQDALSRLKDKDGAVRCTVGAAVARGQAAIADTIINDWTAPNGANAALVANTRWEMAFADAQEAASVMLTDLAAGLETLKDLKVAMAYHDEMNPKAPRLAEGVPSGRTLRDVSLNLAAIREGLAAFLHDAPVADKYRLDAAFDDAGASLAALEHPHGHEKERRESVQIALGAFSALRDTAMAVLPEATGLTLGFNNLDGD